MIVKTSELIDESLDFAVATCLGYTDFHRIPNRPAHEPQFAMMPPRRAYGAIEMWEIGYSTDWYIAGPIIEREKIATRAHDHAVQEWSASPSFGNVESQVSAFSTGPTLLVAAMRCFVASKLGHTVDVPEELCK